jgi:hypothetical protein
MSAMRELEARGAHLYIPRHDHDYAFGVGLRMLILRRIVLEEDGLFGGAGAARNPSLLCQCNFAPRPAGLLLAGWCKMP